MWAAVALLVTLVLPPSPPAHPARVVLVGDSVAESLADALVAEGANRDIEVVVHARVGCGMTTALPTHTRDASLSARCAREAAEYLATIPSGDLTIWLSTWEVGDLAVDGNVLAYMGPEWQAWMLEQYEHALARLGPVLFVTIAPRAPIEGRSTMTDAEAADTLALNDLYRELAREHPTTAGIVDMQQVICPTRWPCPEYVDGIRLRADSAHFGAAGAAWVAPRLLDQVQSEWDRIGALTAAPDGLF